MLGTIRVVLVYTRAICECSYGFAVVNGVILKKMFFGGTEIKRVSDTGLSLTLEACCFLHLPNKEVVLLE